MAFKVKAKETLMRVGNDDVKGTYRYQLSHDAYLKLTEAEVIEEASLRSGIQPGALLAAYDAIGRVMKAFITKGHGVPIPGLGSMRLSLRANTVDDIEKVASGLIYRRRVVFYPEVAIKDAISNAKIEITCYDRDGKEVKRVTSTDAGEVEDPEEEEQQGGQQPGGEELPDGY